MSEISQLSNDQKLKVTYRVEPGCLGPEGAKYVRKFCKFAEQAVVDLDAEFIEWHIVPRFNKGVSEMRYTVNKKQLTHDKADKYLSMFGKELDEFEGHLEERLATIIDDFMSTTH